MKNEEKYVGRAKTQDTLPHEIAVGVLSSAVVEATKVGVKAAIKEIKGRFVEKPKHPRKKSER